MKRFFQFIFLTLLVGPFECLAESTGSERWRIESLNRSLADFTRQWDKLNQRVLDGHPMLDSRFVDALLQHFGDGSERLCLLEKADGTTVGMCILKPSRPGIWISFLPPQAQVAPVILEDASGLPGLLPRIPGMTGQVDLLCQDPKFSPLFDCDAQPHRKMAHAQTISIDLAGDFETYWESRSSNLRHAVRQRENRLAKANLEPRLVRLEAPAEMRGAVTRFGRLESAGWKGRAGTAISIDNEQGPFYADLMERFAATGQAVVYEYWLGNTLAASRLAIATDRMLVLLKTSYDEKLAEFAPGRLMLKEVIRDSFRRHPGGVIEFYTNARQEQLAWATERRWIEHVSLYRNQRVERALAAIRRARDFAGRLRGAQSPA